MLMDNCIVDVKHICFQFFCARKIIECPQVVFGIDSGEAVTYLF
jgi:hypothetical protein